MVLSKLFSNSRSRDKENEKQYIINGYPLTTSPVVPDILKHQVEFKRVKMSGSIDKVGFALAHEGSDLVKTQSLEVMREKILAWYPNTPSITEHFQKELPKNLISISFACYNFEVGESCHEFKLYSNVKPSENGFFTYRKLSESIQCAYYNVNGVEHLAGISFYPTPHGKPKLLKSNEALLCLANNSVIAYPLGDRSKAWYMTQYKFYGRFCATAGKHVLLDCKSKDGVPRHHEYNHATNTWRKSLCKECCEEYFTYKWEEPETSSPVSTVTEAAATPVVSVEEASPTAVAATNAESSTVSRAGSEEDLLKGFDKIEVVSDDESDIDGELID